MTDYNDGKWHGWNGGECPVHPKSKVEAIWDDGSGAGKKCNALDIGWHENATPPCAFRVVTPYIEPQEYSGECWAYHYTSLTPSLVETNINGSTCVNGRWTATHINGKLARITWEAAE